LSVGGNTARNGEGAVDVAGSAINDAVLRASCLTSGRGVAWCGVYAEGELAGKVVIAVPGMTNGILVAADDDVGGTRIARTVDLVGCGTSEGASGLIAVKMLESNSLQGHSTVIHTR
jgi:hypothetical protein